jgi:hypothetical protein
MDTNRLTHEQFAHAAFAALLMLTDPRVNLPDGIGAAINGVLDQAPTDIVIKGTMTGLGMLFAAGV